MKHVYPLILIASFSAASSAASAPATGTATATDLQVAARALSFMENPPTGTVRVGILHTPSDAQSRAEAQSVHALIGAGMRVGNVELQPVLLTPTQLDRSAVDLVFLTARATVADAAAAKRAMSEGVPCVTTDAAQVTSGSCLMGVRARPKVSILVNRAAAAAAGVRFATVFRVMITEL